uniref:Uncharacterized protein n=1 Tax=Lactuca sativa TaxID=4236 RepID=A0A9R1UPD0_LACSA|nr:hypothetical protein LSAT_V11C800427140 [Lactuca sativa]
MYGCCVTSSYKPFCFSVTTTFEKARDMANHIQNLSLMGTLELRFDLEGCYTVSLFYYNTLSFLSFLCLLLSIWTYHAPLIVKAVHGF